MTEKARTFLNDYPAARWAALVLVASMMFFAYMFVDVMSPLKSLVESARGWDSGVFGTYAASEYILNVCGFLILAGIILDKMGIRFTGVLSASMMFIGAAIKFVGISDWFQTTEFCAWLNSWWVSMPGSAKIAMAARPSPVVRRMTRFLYSFRFIAFTSHFFIIDHSQCVIIGVVIFLSALVSEIPFKSWIVGGGLMLGLALLLGGIIFAIMPNDSRDKLMKNYSHVFKRIAIFRQGDDDEEDPDNTLTKDDTRQIDNAHNALGSGGMWGVGLGNSRSKYNYVAEAQNDYIFSIYVEETGFVGGMILIILYMIMFVMCVQVILRADGIFARTVATGCTALIFVEVLMNISVELQVIPATGVTLPFLSYGGTAQIMLLVAYGLILSVSKYGKRPKQKKNKRIAKKAA